MSRYDTNQSPEDQYQPGSHDKVLKNLLGVTSRESMELHETAELWLTQEQLISELRVDHRFTSADICYFHSRWLGGIYSWAGKYREVNLTKAGFTFAMAHTIPMLMADFEKRQLQKCTPCLLDDRDEVAKALAEVHVELMLIHPFREGN